MKLLDFNYITSLLIKFCLAGLSATTLAQGYLLRTTNPKVNSVFTYKQKVDITNGPCGNSALYVHCVEIPGFDENNKQIPGNYTYDRFILSAQRTSNVEYISRNGRVHSIKIQSTSDHGGIYTRFDSGNSKAMYHDFKVHFHKRLKHEYKQYIEINELGLSVTVRQNVPLRLVVKLAGFGLLEGYRILINSNDTKGTVDKFCDDYLVSSVTTKGELNQFLKSLEIGIDIKNMVDQIRNNNGYAVFQVDDGQITAVFAGTEMKAVGKSAIKRYYPILRSDYCCEWSPDNARENYIKKYHPELLKDQVPDTRLTNSQNNNLSVKYL